MTYYTRYFLQQFQDNMTKIVSAEANFLFLKQLAELAMIVTFESCQIVPITSYKFWVNLTKIVRTVINFLFLNKKYNLPLYSHLW